MRLSFKQLKSLIKESTWQEKFNAAGRKNYKMLKKYAQVWDKEDPNWKEKLACNIKKTWMDVDGISKEEAEERYKMNFK